MEFYGEAEGFLYMLEEAIIAGRCPKAACKPTEENKENLKYFLPGKAHNNSSKRPHSLKYNITKGQQNAGKW